MTNFNFYLVSKFLALLISPDFAWWFQEFHQNCAGSS